MKTDQHRTLMTIIDRVSAVSVETLSGAATELRTLFEQVAEGCGTMDEVRRLFAALGFAEQARRMNERCLLELIAALRLHEQAATGQQGKVEVVQ